METDVKEDDNNGTDSPHDGLEEEVLPVGEDLSNLPEEPGENVVVKDAQQEEEETSAGQFAVDSNETLVVEGELCEKESMDTLPHGVDVEKTVIEESAVADSEQEVMALVEEGDEQAAADPEGQDGVALEQEPQTITLSLEEATQIFLQQQGIEGAVHIAPGTYLQVAADGTLGTALGDSGDPLQVITTGEGDLVSYSIHPGADVPTDQGLIEGLDGQFIHVSKPGESGESSQPDNVEVKQEINSEDVTSVEDEQGQTEEASVESSTNCEIITNAEGQFTLSESHYVTSEDGTLTAVNSQHLSSETQLVTVSGGQLMAVSETGQLMPFTAAQFASSTSLPVNSSKVVPVSVEQSVETSPVVRVSTPKVRVTPAKAVKVEKAEPDLNSPIAVNERTEVVIKGKRCVLMMNPETKQMCAYPLLPNPGKKRRGRPRKPRPGEDGYAELPGDAQMSSAAEGLLELSNAGPDGIRRSARSRKKNKVLDDYDVLEESDSDDGNPQDDYEADPEVTIPSIKNKKLTSMTMTTPLGTPGIKRGRGRPRRYPPPGLTTPTGTIPAVVIPSSSGQTLIMAPVQGLHQIQALQDQAKNLQRLEPKALESAELTICDSSLITSTSGKLSSTTTLALDSTNNSMLDSSQILVNELPTDSGDMETDSVETGKKDEETEEGVPGQATIIQIPENMMNMFVQKKDPIKIGIKASETDLERLKCPKCDFQGCYPQQYQDHIATHGEDIQKCKCCNFLTFSKEDILRHFKETHPRCICNICDFMAEHAYIIKRHMMRHNASGCTCEMCGKVYKDQYILKMHVKMVHMPAEVLFECTVCAKKFTRKAHLKRHLRIHDPEKPFKCPYCDYRGCERSDISKHVLIHQEPKHGCEVCGKAFRHIKNKELHVKRHNGQRDYKCGVCDFYGYTFTDIRKHIERKHADIKSLVCDRCGVAFRSDAQLRVHQKEHCEVLMIEQALAIATSTGGTSQATIQIPSTLSVDGKHITIDGQQNLIAVDDGQQITIDGQQIAVDGSHVNITVEQVLPDEEEDLSLTEDGQMVVDEASEHPSEVMSEVIQINREVEDMEETEDIMTMAE